MKKKITKRVKARRPAPKHLRETTTDVLDAALTSAELHLQKLLPAIPPRQVGGMFVEHVMTHLTEELSNIARHGHRSDDPTFTPERPALSHEPACAYRMGHGAPCCCEKDSRSERESVTQPKSGEWRVYEEDTDSRYVVDAENTLIADCFADTHMPFGLPDRDDRIRNAHIIAQAPKMREFIALVAGMATESEFGDNAPPSEDWINTLNNLIASARAILGGK